MAILLSQTSAASSLQWAEGRILVQPRTGVSATKLEQILERSGGQANGVVRGLDVRVVEVPPNAEKAVAAALARNKNIAFAELDFLLPAEATIPDDPAFVSAWHHTKIDTPNAWSQSLGNAVTVAICDTGIDASHPDLEDKLVPGWNSVSGGDTSDVMGHGTQVAGVVGASTNNGVDVASVGWNANIMQMRVSDRSDGYAYYSDIAECITWAADNGARVANVSFDAAGSGTVASAAGYMKNRGGLVTISAGNTGAQNAYSPNDALLAIAATDSSDVRSSFSSYGDYVDLAAPGSGILTTRKGGGTVTVSGTSFSAPVTAGVIALMISANPSLGPEQLETLLLSTSEDLGEPGADTFYGAGRINATAAVTAAAGASAVDIDSPTLSFQTPQQGDTVMGDVAIDVLAEDNIGVTSVELFADSSSIGKDTAEPYQFLLDAESATAGEIILTAVATDAAGNTGSTEITVTFLPQSTDAGPPTVSIVSPSDGASVSGTTTLSALASDDSTLSSVEIFVDGALKCSGVPSVTCTWNTRKAASGEHTISATATDLAGNSSQTSVTVTVGSSTDSGGSKGGGGKGSGGSKGGGKK